MSGSSSEQKRELIDTLSARGLDPQDFVDWLGNQKTGGIDLESWSLEEISKMIATYIGLYGTKATRPTQSLPRNEDKPRPLSGISSYPTPIQPAFHPEDNKSEGVSEKIVVSVAPKEKPMEAVSEHVEESKTDHSLEANALDATGVACVKIIR